MLNLFMQLVQPVVTIFIVIQKSLEPISAVLSLTLRYA